ncbi:MAG: hypothetical protein JOS17DRAFT_753441 [Linnemannia elongata]|nr:MAG: hypothetical protein JOS17DRAFT_753441 [Linnemannia elongata]
MHTTTYIPHPTPLPIFLHICICHMFSLPLYSLCHSTTVFFLSTVHSSASFSPLTFISFSFSLGLTFHWTDLLRTQKEGCKLLFLPTQPFISLFAFQ